MIQKFILVLILSVISFPWPTSLVFSQQEVAAPNYRDGDFWHYRVTSTTARGVSSEAGVIADGTYIIRFSGRGPIRVFNLAGEQELPVDPSIRVRFNSFLGRVREEVSRAPNQYAQDLRFPLFVGKKWEYVWELQAPVGSRNRPVTFAVSGHEPISTSAGTFQAFRIEKYIQWATAGPKRGTSVENIRATYFYSPETKSIVKYNSEATDGAKREYELIKFGSSAVPG